MSCEVSLGEWDGDVVCYQERLLIARAAHACYECGDTIAPGQRYEMASGQYAGEWKRYRFCLPCSEIQKAFCESGRVFGTTWDTFRDEWHNGATLQACLDRVPTVATKEKLHQQWMRWKGLA